MDNLVAVKHNALVTSKYNLSLVEQRVLLSLISKIDSTGVWDGNDGCYQIDFGEVINFIDSKHPNKYEQMKIATDNLSSKTIVIKTKELDDNIRELYKRINIDKHEEPINFEKEEIRTKFLLSPIRYTIGVDSLNLKIDKYLMPFLIELKEHFTVLDLEEALKLKSKYGVRLMEIVSRYAFIGYGEIKYKELREILGIEEHEYKRFNNFNVRVLQTGLKDVLENTNIKFDIELKRKSKVVDSIVFRNISVGKKKKKVIKDKSNVNEIYPKELQDKLVELGVAHLEKLKTEHGITEEVWNLVFAEEKSEQPSHLVTTAKRIAKSLNASFKSDKKKKKESEIISENKKWFEDNENDFNDVFISGSIVDGIGLKKPIKLIDPDFKEKLEKERRSGKDRRTSAPVIQGTSDRRKTKRRNN